MPLLVMAILGAACVIIRVLIESEGSWPAALGAAAGAFALFYIFG